MKTSPTSAGTGCLRSFQCFWVTKIVAALLRNPPPRKSKPVKAMTSWLAGLDLMISLTSRTTLSVRSSDAPSGRITAEKNQPWSSSGTSDPGVMRHKPAASATMPANSASPMPARRTMKPTPPT